jgi:hypothetical protein
MATGMIVEYGVDEAVKKEISTGFGRRGDIG